MSLISCRKAIQSGIAAGVGATGFLNLFTKPLWAEPIVTLPGIQLYTVDKELKADVAARFCRFRRSAIGKLKERALPVLPLSSSESR